MPIGCFGEFILDNVGPVLVCIHFIPCAAAVSVASVGTVTGYARFTPDAAAAVNPVNVVIGMPVVCPQISCCHAGRCNFIIMHKFPGLLIVSFFSSIGAAEMIVYGADKHPCI